VAPHHIASVSDYGLAIREDNSCNSHMRVAAEHVCCGAVSKISSHQRVAPGNKDTPAGGAIQARNLFDYPIKGQWVDLKAAKGAGRTHAKDPGFSQSSDHRRREAAILLGLLRMPLYEGGEAVHGVEQYVEVLESNFCHRLPPSEV
jgi:hypothetical protein